DDLHKPTPVIGSVSGGSWTLAYSLNNDEGAAATPFTTIASGNGPVSNATLGNFDPSVLLNGIYTIKLTSNDVTGFVPPHLLTTITDARGVTVLQNVYNAGGQMTQTRDPQNGSYFYAYPAANQERITDNFPSGLPKTVTDALGNVTRFDYDNNGNVVQQTDALGNLRAFTYDGSNRRLSG
ncbi:MAG TPA: hypothetical protein VNW97_10970, partial [Candidatus Saccharimonadales bacterium]|nr:hypothetical protein [Candidatus Saccharimonadales bacterium]